MKDDESKPDGSEDAWERGSYDSEGNKLPDWEIAWRKRYVASLTPEKLAAMKRPARSDVEARLRAHIEKLEAEVEQAKSA